MTTQEQKLLIEYFCKTEVCFHESDYEKELQELVFTFEDDLNDSGLIDKIHKIPEVKEFFIELAKQ